MPASAVRRATYQDVLDAPANMIAEVIFGALHTQPRPAYPHSIASSNLGAVITSRYRFGEGGPGGWIFIDEPELHLGSEPDILVPDLAGWHRERLAGLPRERPFTTVAPDWLCEVLSPSTQRIDRAEKMEVYLREQVRQVWLVDPLALTLEVYRHGGDLWHRSAIYHGDAVVRAEPFDAIELPLNWLWEP
jgi:Uma2 family endonuclease